MKMSFSLFGSLFRTALCAVTLIGGAFSVQAQETPAPVPLRAHVDVRSITLENGLQVVLAPDRNAPTVTVGVYYNVGFRNEPRDRTGFSHLFEHLMFQGSENLGKMGFIKLVQTSGGILNGSTRYDYTNYYQVIPAHKLETILWAEADRMRGLTITADNLKNQQDVVKNEVRVNVLNAPYGGFPWLALPQHANSNWHNAHNFYGDLRHIDAATLDDAKAFHAAYYPPNNAVLVVAGDMDPTQALAWIQQYFSPIAARPVPPAPDVREPEQTAEKQATVNDPLAPRPALALGYHAPERGSTDWYALGLLDMVLTAGDDGRLVRRLVQEKGYTAGVGSGINYGLGSMFSYNGPMLWTVSLMHDAKTPAPTLIAEIDKVFADVATHPISQGELDRARVRLRSSLYDMIGSSNRFALVDLLASFALFDKDPGKINRLEDGFAAITVADVQRAAQKTLRPANRTVLQWVPAPAPIAPQQGPAQ